jgi:hypothetical protein
VARLTEPSAGNEAMRASTTTIMSRSLLLLAPIVGILLLSQVADAGLTGDGAVRIVKAIVNYDVSFDLGANERWIRSGIQYAPPF